MTELPTSKLIYVLEIDSSITEPLTVKDEIVIVRLCNGFTREEIARAEDVSLSTVDSWVRNMRKKFKASTPEQAACLAVKSGLVRI